MAAALLAVLGLALLGAESGSGAGSAISTSISTDGSKTHLTCTLNGSDTEIVGHRWVKGDKVLKEDALPGLKTQYESAASWPPCGPSWASWPRCSCWSPSSSSTRSGGSRTRSRTTRTPARRL
uniref:Basigin (Ok blood group) n=1 Tax=Rousettus aegyptiacus TaxID=9407 RepID=A0A7J8BNZ7_ROUAE|nr:basigin (Ok blood group) [Rousettus aegyptiacus]